jgi:hypothetical protein
MLFPTVTASSATTSRTAVSAETVTSPTTTSCSSLRSEIFYAT